MAAFLEDITPFLGENTVNEDGLTLPQFLEDYDPNKYQNPSVTADIMVFWAKENLNQKLEGLKLLLIRRKNHPSIGWWALPGGFIDIREDADKAAKRELMEETGLTDVAVEQICAWGDYNRDPRTRIVTLSYIALLEEYKEANAGDDAQDAAWFDVSLKLSKEEMIDSRKMKTYELVLTDSKKGTKLSACVTHSYRMNSILKEEKYEVVSRDRLAFDHPAFIVRGLMHLKQRLAEQMYIDN